MSTVFIDTNIWCYYLDARLPEHAVMKDTVAQIIRTHEIASNTLVIMEVAHYLTRRLEEGEARDKLRAFTNLKTMKIHDFDKELMTSAVELLIVYGKGTGLGGRDASILATLEKHSIAQIVTHDAALSEAAQRMGVKATDPVFQKL